MTELYLAGWGKALKRTIAKTNEWFTPFSENRSGGLPSLRRVAKKARKNTLTPVLTTVDQPLLSENLQNST